MPQAADFSRPIGEAIAELAGLHHRDTPEQFQTRVKAAFGYNLLKSEADRILSAARRAMDA